MFELGNGQLSGMERLGFGKTTEMKRSLLVSLWRDRKPLLLLFSMTLVFFLAYLRYSEKATNAGGTLDIPTMVVFEETEPSVTNGGLTIKGKQFYLAEKQFRILSGAVHYFRVVPEHWRDRLIKLKAMGLNTVETYVPWNLHEETKGQFKFDGNLDLRAFIKIAQELGLFVIIRPGPYICSEWDFGGLPSWLLHDPIMQPRTMYHPYVYAVEQYFSKLLPLLVPLQFSHGGPIIAFQIENEYGSFSHADVNHMRFLKSLMIRAKLTELLFTSDNSHGIEKHFLSLPNVLRTVNFGAQARVLDGFEVLDKEKPFMVAEYWIGWFDHWHERHHVVDPEDVAEGLTEILKLQGSVNLYMFHGGTNFGFMNGANSLSPTITSYDYDAALSEAGDITPKYKALRNVIKQYAQIPNDLPAVLENSPKEAYGKVVIRQHMTLEELLQYHIPFESENVLTMEQLPINNFGGQGYGFTLYQTDLTGLPKEILIEKVLDRAQVFVNSVLIHISDVSLSGTVPETEWMVKIKVDNPALSKAQKYILEILVENMGRTNIGWDMRVQRKGIQGRVMVDGQNQTGWKIVPLEFKAGVLSRLKEKENWNVLPEELPEGPSLYRGTFQVNGEPRDTFLHMEGWTKGVCFINGHNLGRYWNVGPQMTLYVPGPWLHKGENCVIIFELHKMKTAEVSFVSSPVLQG